MREFKFPVSPGEDIEDYELRWNKAVAEFLSQGHLLRGFGPEGDEPKVVPMDDDEPEGSYWEVWKVATNE